MRRLIKIALLLALIWSGVWALTDLGLVRGMAAWLSAQRARGWQVEYSALDSSGYPFRHGLRLSAPMIADPRSGWAWRADWLGLQSPALWPGNQRLIFPATEQRLSLFGQEATLKAQAMQARLALRPGPALRLDRLELTAGDWQLTAADGVTTGAGRLLVSMIQQGPAEEYRLMLSAPTLAPGGALPLTTTVTDTLPAGFDTFGLQARVRFDRPWDRRALTARRPQPRALLLDQADVRWGAMAVSARGAIDIDPQGQPSGTLAIRAENWRQMLDLSVASGVLAPQRAEQLGRLLALLAGTGDDSDTLDTELRFAGGLMLLGPLPLGPAPSLRLR
ncbi:DUF2125 domain-containing protein [Pseudodonghicola xiamenensis]|uniref:DUF2125 domain-containing protein n=1 Tax=Pseudodonghicola xiamenensis TaxID=337702 RepID=A0A8J3H9E4_9RHOB|nr:DUF2125 domain-containing protein [Pseudodonghicola xiamenensis]GHG93391.1 hypothetical protein GCM10010961_25830 [Pseudodonghicola xiamenensis]